MTTSMTLDVSDTDITYMIRKLAGAAYAPDDTPFMTERRLLAMLRDAGHLDEWAKGSVSIDITSATVRYLRSRSMPTTRYMEIDCVIRPMMYNSATSLHAIPVIPIKATVTLRPIGLKVGHYTQ